MDLDTQLLVAYLNESPHMEAIIQAGATDLDTIIHLACLHRKHDMLRLLLRYFTGQFDTIWAIACMSDDVVIIGMVLDHGAMACGLSLHRIAKLNYLDIMKLIIARGFKDLRWALMGACEGGHMDMARLIVSAGETRFNCAFVAACECGHVNLAQYMLDLGAVDIEFGLRQACLRDQVNVIRFLVGRGAHQFNRGLYVACLNGSVNAGGLMYELGADNISEGLIISSKRGHVNTAKLMLTLGAPIVECTLDLSCDDVVELYYSGVKLGPYERLINEYFTQVKICVSAKLVCVISAIIVGYLYE